MRRPLGEPFNYLKDLPDGTWVEVRNLDERDENGIGYVVLDWHADGDYGPRGQTMWREFTRKAEALKYYNNFWQHVEEVKNETATYSE